jgi:hypothetical protein
LATLFHRWRRVAELCGEVVPSRADACICMADGAGWVAG